MNIDLFKQDFVGLRETRAIQNINKVTGERLVISGRVPEIIGITPNKGGAELILEISGKNALNTTGVKFTATFDPSQECHMSSGEFIPETTTITRYDPISKRTTTNIETGWHFTSVYTGEGKYQDMGEWVQVFKIYPCDELRIFGTVDIDLMYLSLIHI